MMNHRAGLIWYPLICNAIAPLLVLIYDLQWRVRLKLSYGWGGTWFERIKQGLKDGFDEFLERYTMFEYIIVVILAATIAGLALGLLIPLLAGKKSDGGRAI